MSAEVVAFPDRARDEAAAAAILDRAGISWGRLRDERNQAMCVLAAAGWTTREIGAVFEVNHTTVARVLVQDAPNREKDPRGGDRTPPAPEAEVDTPPPPPAPRPLHDTDQAHAEADVINAFRALVRQTFTPQNVQNLTPKARRLLADALQDALNIIEMETGS